MTTRTDIIKIIEQALLVDVEFDHPDELTPLGLAEKIYDMIRSEIARNGELMSMKLPIPGSDRAIAQYGGRVCVEVEDTDPTAVRVSMADVQLLAVGT